MKTIVRAASVLLLPLLLTAQDQPQPYAAYGELLVTGLASAPFPHPRRAEGHVYADRLFPADLHYGDSSVALFIPKGYRQMPTVDLVIHLHGWWNNIDTTLKRYQLPQQLAESGKNVILVVPEGPKNAPDSFGGKLEDAGGLRRFVHDVVGFLYRSSKITTQNIGRIILSGHSGAYHAISFALMRGGMADKVSEVYLFDALYGQTEKYSYWIDHERGRLVTIYTDSGGTREETEALMEDLDGWGIRYYQTDEARLTPADLQNNRLVFIHTDLEHDMVMNARNEFRLFLQTSALSDR